MSSPNLRHFRVFLAVAELRSPTLASERCRVSQPAVTQSLGKLERKVSGTLFERTRQGFFLTEEEMSSRHRSDVPWSVSTPLSLMSRRV
jgi:DNA-binding transcriptional LysR family regulator